MIWVLLIVAGGLCAGGLYVMFIQRRHRARESVPALWTQLIAEGALNELPNKDDLLKLFLVPDLINPLAFFANWTEVYGSSRPFSSFVGGPTPSAKTFSGAINAPVGYEPWFLAAYPDVVLWLATRDEDTMLRVAAEAVYGADAAKELIGTYGLQRASELIDEKVREFDLQQLRRLIEIYRRNTGKRLECSV